MSKLPDVRGRITYISSHAKQENLYAVYETTDRHYWADLAKCNQQEFKKSGTEGKCIEAREFIIPLPESFPNLYEPDKLLQLFTDRFKENEYRMRWNREVDRAIVSGVAETEIQQIKKEYISDRIRESLDVFGNQPERLGTILMSAVAVLAMLVSKVLQKARELSAKLFDTEQIPPHTPKQEPVQKQPEKEMPNKPKIPPKPVMSAEAAAYPKLFKIYKELKRQNEIILRRKRNVMRGNLSVTI